MAPPNPLESLFVAALGRDVPTDSELGTRLGTFVETARSTHPNLNVSDRDFVCHAAEHVKDADDPSRALESVIASDLYLACACLCGHGGAIAEVERRHFRQAFVAVARIVGAAAGDEVMQVLRHKLFVAEPGRSPKIAEYGGRGSLGGWLRVVAVRTALTLRRESRREDERHDSDDMLLELHPAPNRELDVVRDRYRVEFKSAFQHSLAALTARERNLLRLQFIDGLNIDQIGSIYRVHRSTVARWVAKARESLFEGTQSRLRETMGISGSEFASVIALVQSQIDVSIHRYLGADEE